MEAAVDRVAPEFDELREDDQRLAEDRAVLAAPLHLERVEQLLELCCHFLRWENHKSHRPFEGSLILRICRRSRCELVGSELDSRKEVLCWNLL